MQSVETPTPNGPLPRASEGAGDGAYLSVLQVLDLPPMEGARLLTDPSVAAQRLVSRCSVQELPFEAEFIRPQEFVLTGAVGLRDDPAGFLELIRSIASVGGSALAVAVGGNVSEVPTAAIELANGIGLPLIELPWEKRFSEIIEAILERVLERQHLLLRQSEQIHELLTDVVLSGGQLSQVCDSVSALLERPVTIMDRWGEPADGTSRAGDDEAGAQRQATTLPIAANGQPLGTMYVMATDKPLSDLDLRIARHGTTAAALIMLMQKAFVEGETRSRTEFIWALLHGWIDAPRSVEQRAAALGIEPKRPYFIVYLRLDTNATDASATDVGRWALSRAMAARRMPQLDAWQGVEASLLVPAGTHRSDESIRHVVDDAASLVRRHISDAHLTAGIGGTVGALVDAPRSFREAMTACRLGYIVNGPGSLTRYGDLGAYPALFDLVSSAPDGGAFETLRHRYLEPILSYEARSRLPLIETLTALFDANGNVSAAARALGINRQSLLYRLGKVEALTGVNLTSPVSRFALEMAVRAQYLAVGITPGAVTDRRAVVSEAESAS